MENLENFSIEELTNFQHDLMSQRRDIVTRLREVARTLNKRLSDQSLDDDLIKLKHKHGSQVLKAAGIPSAESVNGG